MADFLEATPITIILFTKSTQANKRLHCHKPQLAENSEFFKALFYGSMKKDKNEYLVETDNIELDAILIAAMYVNKYDFTDYSFEDKYTILLRMKYYGLKNMNMSLIGLDKKITPSDCIFIINNYQNIDEINNILSKYVRLFIIDVITISKSSIDILYHQNKQLVEQIIIGLSYKPSFAYSEYDIKEFYKQNGYICHQIDGCRTINEKELKLYSYLPNAKNLHVFHFDHFVLYKMIKHYNANHLIGNLKLDKMHDNQLFAICRDTINANIKEYVLKEIEKRYYELKSSSVNNNDFKPDKSVPKSSSSSAANFNNIFGRNSSTNPFNSFFNN